MTNKNGEIILTLPSHITIAELDNGLHVIYDTCVIASSDSFPSDKKWKYIGTGKIYSVDGSIYRGNEKYKFYQKL